MPDSSPLSGRTISTVAEFLPDEIAKDAQALVRLQREAQAASALNHSNRHVGHPLQFAAFSTAKTARGMPE
jgi:hypothetical protein